MGTYQGQAALVLRDETKIEGQAMVRTSKRSWAGTIVVGPEERERANEATRIELPTGEIRPVSVNDAALDTSTGAYIITFASDDG